MSYSLSLRARLTLWYTAALVMVLAIGGAGVLWEQGRIGLARVDRQLTDLTATVENLANDELNEDPHVKTAAEEVIATIAAPGRAVAILDRNGQQLAGNWNGLQLTSPPASFDSGPRVWTTETPAPWRVHADPRTIRNQPLLLVTAAPLADVLRERRDVQEALSVGIPIGLLIAAVGGLWLASIGLRPITRMAVRATNTSVAGDDDLGESGRTDELGQLARAFNGLLVRLRTALRTQRQFMADASHELRTPVSVIRSAAEVTLARDHRDEAEYREALGIVATEARRVGRLVDDMLVLARGDAGGYPLRQTAVYLDELVAECRRTLELLARERAVSLCTSADHELPFEGDEELLKRMLVNLIQNAIHHTRPGGKVAINLSNGSHLAIDVVDEGPGIPAEDQERIFDRFVQLERSRRGSGTGLGLPIARWIAEAHGGSLSLESSSSSGSTFRVMLPLRRT